jgi:hypothetical protein
VTIDGTDVSPKDQEGGVVVTTSEKAHVNDRLFTFFSLDSYRQKIEIR